MLNVDLTFREQILDVPQRLGVVDGEQHREADGLVRPIAVSGRTSNRRKQRTGVTFRWPDGFDSGLATHRPFSQQVGVQGTASRRVVRVATELEQYEGPGPVTSSAARCAAAAKISRKADGKGMSPQIPCLKRCLGQKTTAKSRAKFGLSESVDSAEDLGRPE